MTYRLCFGSAGVPSLGEDVGKVIDGDVVATNGQVAEDVGAVVLRRPG